MKTNKELNTAHEAKLAGRIRPSKPAYDFKPLEAVIRQWVMSNEQT